MKKFLSIMVTVLALGTACQSQYVPPSGGGSFSWMPASNTNFANSFGVSLDGMPGITDVTFSGQILNMVANNCNDLVSFTGKNIADTTTGDIEFNNDPSLSSVKFPNLKYLVQGIEIVNCPLTVLDLHAVTNVTTFIINGTSLTNLILSRLVTQQDDFGGLQLNGNSALTNIDLSNYVPSDNNVFDTYNSDALTAQSINGILVRYVDNQNLTTGTIDISGGSNATPDATGQGYVQTLTDRGVFVITN